MNLLHKKDIDVTVVVASYNPVWEKLQRTLCSIIFQKNINIEIIIVDDGSEHNLFENIKDLFENYNFKEYRLIDSDINQGTCMNSFRGMKIAKGKYIKFISPGDYLYEDKTLKVLFDYAVKNNIEVCFGEAIYYSEKKGEFKVWEVIHCPCNMRIYLNENLEKNALKLNYLVWNDFALGASFFSKTSIAVEYLEKIIGKVKYVEDNIYRLMVLDGIKIHYFQSKIIWYEFGTGISTSRNHKWGKKIKKDIIAANKIMRKNMKVRDFFDFRYQFLLLIKKMKIQRWVGCILFPEGIKYLLYRKKFPVYTITDYDLSFYKKIQLSGGKLTDNKEMKDLCK